MSNQDHTIAAETESGIVVIAEATHIELGDPEAAVRNGDVCGICGRTSYWCQGHEAGRETVGGYEVPVDPMDLLQCDSCQ